MKCLRDLKVKILSKNDLDDYLLLVKKVKDKMKYPEWLGDFSKEDLFTIAEIGKIYLWFDEDEIVCAALLIPSTKKDLDKFFSSDLDYSKVVDFGPEMVNPSYIGRGLQREMLKFLENESLNMGYEYAISTIHPNNIYSRRNLEYVGFQNIGQVTLKRGIRVVYRKRIKNER